MSPPDLRPTLFYKVCLAFCVGSLLLLVSFAMIDNYIAKKKVPPLINNPSQLAK